MNQWVYLDQILHIIYLKIVCPCGKQNGDEAAGRILKTAENHKIYV